MRGIAAARCGELAEARRYLERLLYQDPDTATLVEAWYWLSRVSSDPQEKRRYLEQVLACEPFEPRARRELAILDGKLDPTRIIDPDRPCNTPNQAPQGQPQRMTCSKCGGRLAYAPDGATLLCESCETRQRMGFSHPDDHETPAGMGEQDFAIAMATAQGHLHPEVTRTIACQGCGAEFLLPPEVLSLTCPYCNSVYVVDKAGTRELVAPSGLIPFQFDRLKARQTCEDYLRDWGEPVSLPPGAPQALYQPVWCFTVSGQAPWNCQRYSNRRWIPDMGANIVFFRDMLIAASPKLQTLFPHDIQGYTLSALVPYDGRYLADWPAETYQVSMADASLKAREFALEETRRQIQDAFLDETRNLTVSSAEIAIESFRLVLLPVWTV
ncbi:MAG: hypothetical protein PHQ40_15140, partial [Anaerolineaceae bacterium]|nr:hypothetical protein [Anaerolineaceae bacterium]